MASEQLYNHQGITQVANDLKDTATKLQNRLDTFAEDVKKELPEWKGDAADSFERFHADWDQKIKELQTFAANLPAVVEDINERARQADKAGSNLF